MNARRIFGVALWLFGIVLIVASGSSSDSGSDGAATWSKSFGGDLSDSAAAAIPTADGGYLFVGNRDAVDEDSGLRTAGSVGLLWVTKLDALGDIEWERRLSDAAVGTENGQFSRFFNTVVAAADGGAWLIGGESENGVYRNLDIVVTRLGSGGESLWTRTYDSDWVVPDAHFYPDGETEDSAGAATETPEGTLWIAASADAFVKDTSVDNAGNNVGIDLSSTYLLKLAADGTVLVSHHNDLRAQRFGSNPKTIRPLADGGVAVLVSGIVHDFVLLIDAGGVMRSKTAIGLSDTFVLSGVAQPDIVDVVPMRRAAVQGLAGDDGYVVVGRRNGWEEDSFVARYLAGARDPDDPTEGEDRREVSPRENAWRLEVPEIAPIWAAVANCGAAPPVNQRCGVIVAGKGRAAAGTMALARIDPDSNVGGMLRILPDVERVCAIQQEPALTTDGHLAFRLLVRRPDGRSGTLVIDDLLNLTDGFRDGPGLACGDTKERLGSATFAPDGEWVALNHTDAALTVSRMTLSGAERWRHPFATEGGRWKRAFVARQTDDDGDGALDDGYIVAGESGSGNDSGEQQAFMLKLEPQGAISWQRALPGLHFTAFGTPATSTEFAAVQSAGYGLVVRDSTGATRALSMDPTGAINWQQSLWDHFFDASIVPLRDGGWLVGAGRVVRDGAVLARLASSGETRWTRTLSNLDVVDSTFETAAGELVVGGRRLPDPVVAKFDASGLPIWSRRLKGIGTDALGYGPYGAVHVAPASRDGVFVATTVRGAATDAVPAEGEPRGLEQDLLLQQFDADGTPRGGEERRYGGRYDDVLTSLAATSDGGAILAARSNSLGERNDRTEAWLLRLGPDGRISSSCAAELAAIRFDGILVGEGAVTGAVADRLALGAVDGAPLPIPTDFSLFALSSSSPSTVARQCSGSVGPSPNEPRAPVAHLRVIQGGAISGVVTSVPAGILCGVAGDGMCEFDFDQGLSVTLNVDPGSRPTFESWAGCDSANGTQCLVRMDAARTVTATFATDPVSPTVILGLSSITGRGRVTGTGINCRSGSNSADVCRVSLQRGSMGQLTATPDTNRTFLGWGGDCASFGNTRSILFVMNQGRACTAQFSGPPPGAPEITVDVRPSGAGNVRSEPSGIDCGASNSLCTEGFASGTDVTLTAAATLPGWEFDNFLCQGQVRTPERSTTIAGLTSNKLCQANFSEAIERLFVRIVRDVAGALATGRVYVDGGGLDCRRDCDRPFLRDQLLIVRAEPYPEYVLSAWSGCRRVLPDNTNPGADSYCEVRMDQRREVVAFFSRLGPNPNPLRSLVVNFANGTAPGLVTGNPGSIDCTPTDGICVNTFDVGTSVSLTAVPAAGGSVASHVGCDTFIPATGAAPALCGVTLAADRVVTFGFARANSTPVAAYAFEPINPTAGQAITFNAATSTDDNGIASYAWSFQNNGSVDATSSIATHTYFSAGSYTARLTVTDADGLSDDEIRTIVVAPAPLPTVLLTLSVNGGGRVVSTPPGIDCASQQPQPCSANFTTNQVVSLAITPDVGKTFDHLGGDPQCDDVAAPNGNATVTLTANLQCSADFVTALNQWTRDGLSLNTTPGSVAAFVGAPVIEIGADGRAVAAFAENGAVVVRRWDGSAWRDIGSALGNGTAETVSLAIDSTGAPIVAWDERDTTVFNGSHNVSAARWNGTVWDALGGAFVDVDLTADAFSPSIRARSTDLVLAWGERDVQTGEPRVVVRAWNGTTWVNAGVSDGPASMTAFAEVFAPRLAVGPADELAVAWVETFGTVIVAQLQGGLWVPTATPPLPIPMSGMFIDALDIGYSTAEGLLVVATPVVPGPVTVRRWRAGAWSDLGTARGNFGSPPPRILGVAFSHNRTGATPLLAYTHRNAAGSTSEFVVERFNSTDWARVGNVIPAISRHGTPGFESRIGVTDALQPSVVTRVIATLPNTVSSDQSIVAYRFQ